MAAKFEISSKAGQFNWVLKSQGRTLATGEAYRQRAAAAKAIESLRKAVAGATVSDLTVKAAPAKAAAKPAKAAAKPAKAAAKKAATAKKATTAKKAATAKKAPPRRRAATSG
jgi:DNA topoisomerase-1